MDKVDELVEAGKDPLEALLLPPPLIYYTGQDGVSRAVYIVDGIAMFVFGVSTAGTLTLEQAQNRLTKCKTPEQTTYCRRIIRALGGDA